VRGLLPYATVAALVVVGSIVALLVATGGIAPAAPAAASRSPSAAPAASRQSVTDLSPLGRLAYWRTETTGDYQLWVANADNSRRRSVAKADTPGLVTKTKWSADGNAVAYVEGGTRLVVVRVDGSTATYTLSPELRQDGYRIVDHRFSPSGARLAATVQRANGSQSDVYLAASNGTWTRLTTVEDTLAADWVDEDDLLIHSTGGVISRLRASGTNNFRPLIGLQSSSPIVGADGRVHFLAGRVSGFAGTTETFVFAAAASVWSMTADGTDVRREVTPPDQESLRLDGTWPGGYAYHRGTNPQQLVIGSIPILLPSSAGLIERIAVSPDKRFAIGFAGTSVVRVEITSNGLAPSATLLLGSADQGDVWFPRSAAIARAPRAAAVDVPAARFAFSLGGNVWTMGSDGVARIVRPGAANGQTQRRFALLLLPQWSPSGDRILTVESLGSGTSASQLVAVLIDPSGAVTRLTQVPSIMPQTSWSPDGTALAVVALPSSLQDPSILQSELEVRLLKRDGTSAGASIKGREAVWTAGGVMVISNGTIRPSDRARDDQAIELWSGTQKKTVTTVARLVADPRAQAPAASRGITSVSVLSASPDGAFATVRMSFLGTTATPVLALVRASDGAPIGFTLADRFSDESWSATRPLIGYTTSLGQLSDPKLTAIVRDASTGLVVTSHDGARFAGWSPDGAWYYIARSDGLYAVRLGGGDPLRVSTVGVPVSVTRP